jgi:UrcA family protein
MRPTLEAIFTIKHEESIMKAINTSTRFTVAAICGSFALGLATAASANDTRSITVKFADLDVSTQQGADELYSRIAKAAKTVCTLVGSPSIFGSRDDSCVNKAIADAVTKVNQKELYSVYNRHNTPPLTPTLLSQTR